MMIGGPISKETAGDIWAGLLLIVWVILNLAFWLAAGAIALWLVSLLFSLI